MPKTGTQREYFTRRIEPLGYEPLYGAGEIKREIIYYFYNAVCIKYVRRQKSPDKKKLPLHGTPQSFEQKVFVWSFRGRG